MFKIRPFPKKDLKWWHSKAASIEFNPDFQRTSRVWKGRDQAFLIDSILNGFDIPKIYIADFTTTPPPSSTSTRRITRSSTASSDLLRSTPSWTTSFRCRRSLPCSRTRRSGSVGSPSASSRSSIDRARTRSRSCKYST